jgi:hypothetical protein
MSHTFGGDGGASERGETSLRATNQLQIMPPIKKCR